MVDELSQFELLPTKIKHEILQRTNAKTLDSYKRTRKSILSNEDYTYLYNKIYPLKLWKKEYLSEYEFYQDSTITSLGIHKLLYHNTHVMENMKVSIEGSHFIRTMDSEQYPVFNGPLIITVNYNILHGIGITFNYNILHKLIINCQVYAEKLWGVLHYMDLRDISPKPLIYVNFAGILNFRNQIPYGLRVHYHLYTVTISVYEDNSPLTNKIIRQQSNEYEGSDDITIEKFVKLYPEILYPKHDIEALSQRLSGSTAARLVYNNYVFDFGGYDKNYWLLCIFEPLQIDDNDSNVIIYNKYYVKEEYKAQYFVPDDSYHKIYDYYVSFSDHGKIDSIKLL